MPKPRTLDSDFWDDEDVAGLTHQERLMLIGMITLCADDRGRMQGHAPYFCKHIFGYDDMSVEQVQQMRDAIVAKCRNVHLYTVNDREYIWLANFEDRQNIRYVVESKLPPPPDSLTNQRPTENSRKLPQKSADSPRVGLGSVEQGRVGKGRVAVAEDSVENAAPAADFGAVYQAVEDTLGKLSAKASEQLKDYWQDDFAMLTIDQWEDACRDCAEHNGRNLLYLRKCLETRRDGGTGPPGKRRDWYEQYAGAIER